MINYIRGLFRSKPVPTPKASGYRKRLVQKIPKVCPVSNGDQIKVHYTLEDYPISSTEKTNAFSFYNRLVRVYDVRDAMTILETHIYFDPDKPWDEAFSAEFVVEGPKTVTV
jgi:hypothetical protein